MRPAIKMAALTIFAFGIAELINFFFVELTDLEYGGIIEDLENRVFSQTVLYCRFGANSDIYSKHFYSSI